MINLILVFEQESPETVSKKQYSIQFILSSSFKRRTGNFIGFLSTLLRWMYLHFMDVSSCLIYSV